jgi:hypothetical protein
MMVASMDAYDYWSAAPKAASMVVKSAELIVDLMDL